MPENDNTPERDPQKKEVEPIQKAPGMRVIFLKVDPVEAPKRKPNEPSDKEGKQGGKKD
ncbi:MAG: hypothetical protein HGA38_03045 [Candidatus Moranbacteria bacterium]|nr:hypothetical protein [Candidatus Moranbacteria bacterium]NTW46355.1 hypothetical protein [Candidatus Moranbacteria bacterium]